MSNYTAEWSDFLSAPPVIDAAFIQTNLAQFAGEYLTFLQFSDIDCGIFTWQGGNSIGEFTVLQLNASYGFTGTTGQQQLQIVGEGSDRIVLPLMSAGNFIEFSFIDSHVIPQTIFYSWVQRSGLYTNTIFGPTAYVIDETQTIATTDEGVFRPAIFVPAKHQLFMDTNATSWTLDFEYATTAMAYSTFPLASSASPLPLGHTINGPAGSWQLRFTNNDGADRDCRILAIREP